MGQIITIILLVLVLILVLLNVRIVPQEHAYIIERLGKFKSVWYAGLHVKIPFFDQIVNKISLKEQVFDFPPQPVITKDNVSVKVDSVVFSKVFDPQKYTYGVENPIAGLQNLSATTLRSIIGGMELDTTLSSRESINSQMEAILDEATDPWGIKVNRVELKNIDPPKEIEEVMTKQMRAERERRQTVLEAQAHQESVVSRAEGDKKAKVLAAEAEKEAKIALAQGEAESIRLVYEAQADGLEKLKELGMISESLGIGDATPVDNSAPAPKTPEVDPCITEETSKVGRRVADVGEEIREDLESRRKDVLKRYKGYRRWK